VVRLGRPGGLSAAGKKQLWERWRAGESISYIARALRKAPGSIHRMIEATGGFTLSERRRRGCALTLAEQEEISRGLATGESLRAIADRPSRSASTISVATDDSVYFCDPRSPWQRGTSENKTGSCGSTCPERPICLCTTKTTST
jgi:IS30 family transposase